ncbi:MAG: ABC transporter permease [Christensenellales bacterium]
MHLRIRKKLQLAVRHWQFYLIMLVPLVYLFIFHYIPMYGMQIAFRQFSPSKGIAGSPWIGFENFRRFLSAYNFRTILWNTISLSLYEILASFPFPLVFAIMINEVPSRRFKRSVQMISYAPHFISTIVIVAIMNQLLNLRFGIVNNLIEIFGGQRINFLADPKLFKTLYVFSGIWQHTGYAAILYIAALAAVDPTLYEAASIDGASKLQKIRYIDLPCLMPTAIIILILNMGNIMNVGIDKVLAMQNDANMGVSEVISTYVYNIGIINSDFSYATAAGTFNSVINLTLLLSLNALAKRVSETSLF